ncbi:MAG: EpsI family protein [Novosphingobium sp.]
MIRRRDLLGAVAFAVAAGGTSAGAVILQQKQRKARPGRDRVLAALPDQLGAWKRSPESANMVSPVELDGAFAEALSLYDRVIAANYVAHTLPAVMLNIAYMRELRQERRFHWPEICYATQGFDVSRLTPIQVHDNSELPLARFLARSSDHTELVAYTIRVGDRNIVTTGELREALFVDGLSLEVPDGFLVRASVNVEYASHADYIWTILKNYFSLLDKYINIS